MKRKTIAYGAAAAAGAAAVPTLVRRRWMHTDDPTGGEPLVLPSGVERTVKTGDGAALAVLDCGPGHPALGGEAAGPLGPWHPALGGEAAGPLGPDAERPGSGQVIVAVHGWTADRRVWGPVARRLVDSGRRVVLYDQRGHGVSTVGRSGCTMEAIGDDVRAVLEDLDLHDVVLAGHSMGGMAVEEFAVRHSDVLAERVAAVVLVATLSRGPFSNRRVVEAAYRVVTSPVTQRALENGRTAPWLMRSSEGRRPAWSHLVATSESFAATPPGVRGEFLRAMAGLDLTSGLSGVAVPVVVVAGTRDTVTPFAANRRIVEAIPGARLETVSAAGHQLVFEAPDRLAEVLLEASAAAN